MTSTDDGLLAWRNLIVDWHLRQEVPLACGCDDDTEDADYCPGSVLWADTRLAERADPALAGPADRWNHDVWRAAWGRNAPLIMTDTEVRLPRPPQGMTWLATRLLVGGRCAVELALYAFGEDRLTTVSRARVVAEPSTVAARARAILNSLSD